MILPVEFYRRPTLDVARDLVGKILRHRTAQGVAAGVIVEVEAYIGELDPACHAAAGRTPRNAPLYGPPGRAYVYLNYGLHYLINAVTEDEGMPAAVLIRALEPIEGLAAMRRRRQPALERPRTPRGAGRSSGATGAGPVRPADHALCRGPGNLTRALGISLADNLKPLTRGALIIEDRGVAIGPVAWGPRVGIRVGVDRPWRAAVVGHPSVSGGEKEKVKR